MTKIFDRRYIYSSNNDIEVICICLKYLLISCRFQQDIFPKYLECVKHIRKFSNDRKIYILLGTKVYKPEMNNHADGSPIGTADAKA